MKKKIINILCHTFDKRENLSYHLNGNWATRLARNIRNATNKFDCEAWYAITGITHKKAFKKDGVTIKLFPARTLNRTLESYYGIVQTPELFKELTKQDPTHTLIHFQGERGSILHELLGKYPQYKVVLQYHGYGQHPLFNWVERLFITPQEKKHFPSIKHFFSPIKTRFSYLHDVIGISQNKISFENSPVNFTKFKPSSKKQARKRLNLPPNAYIMLYVGNMVQTKGVDKILTSYSVLKKKYPYLYMLLVGANPADPLYNQAKSIADRVIHTTPNTELPYYYTASDVYCFYGTPKTVLYAGPGIALCEALASNINAVSTNLIHFPDKLTGRLGILPQSPTDMTEKIEFLIQNPRFKYNPRRLIKKYASHEKVIRNTIKVYEHIFNEKN